MRLCDFEMIEHGERVGVEMPVAVDLGRRRHVRRRVAARGIGDAAVAAREVTHLRLPIGVVGGEFVQEDDRRPAAGLLEIEPDIVAGDGIGHLLFLLTGRASKIAVNARGCNAAGSGPGLAEGFVNGWPGRSSGFGRWGARARICEDAPSVLRSLFPHLPQAGVSVGDDRRLVEECQCGRRKPNEDAVSVPSGRNGRLREEP